MRVYTFKVIITEGSDEYWEALRESNGTGCDEVLLELTSAISEQFPIEAIVQLVEFKET